MTTKKAKPSVQKQADDYAQRVLDRIEKSPQAKGPIAEWIHHAWEGFDPIDMEGDLAGYLFMAYMAGHREGRNQARNGR